MEAGNKKAAAVSREAYLLLTRAGDDLVVEHDEQYFQEVSVHNEA